MRVIIINIIYYVHAFKLNIIIQILNFRGRSIKYLIKRVINLSQKEGAPTNIQNIRLDPIHSLNSEILRSRDGEKSSVFCRLLCG